MRRLVSRSPAGAPSTMTSPPLGRASPSSSLTAVVLPAPFGPRNPKISPRLTVIDSPSSATVPRYCLRSSIACTAGDAAGPAAPPGSDPVARPTVLTGSGPAACSAELARDTQHILFVEQAGHRVHDAAPALPDDS